MMFKRLLLALSLLGLTAAPALASNCAAYPYTLTNGSTADANQVMSNFNSILNCGNNNLAKNGANSDITSLTGLTTPLSVAQGGTGSATTPGGLTNLGAGAAAVEALGSNVVDDGSGNLTVAHGAQVFTSSGTFTASALTGASTVFKITACGGGGGGGGSQTSNAPAASGASGGCGAAYFTGIPASGTMTIAIGAAGTAGSSSGGNGGTGGTTTVTYSAVAIVTATGGTGGHGYTGTFPLTPGSAGSFSSTASGTSLTRLTSLGLPGDDGRFTDNVYYSDAGGASFFASGGSAVANNTTGEAGTHGSGGGAAYSGNSTARAGGAGGAGEVLIEW